MLVASSIRPSGDSTTPGTPATAPSSASAGSPATVDAIEELGADAFIYCGADVGEGATRLTARDDARHVPARGERVHLRPSGEYAPHVFDADSGERIGA